MAARTGLAGVARLDLSLRTGIWFGFVSCALRWTAVERRENLFLMLEMFVETPRCADSGNAKESP